MNADLLCEAAALMRARAEAATPGPWAVTSTTAGLNGILSTTDLAPTVYSTHAGAMRPDDMRYIASWHPAVALAVADWLDNAAEDAVMQAPGGDLRFRWDIRVDFNTRNALAVARAYLGRDA